MNEKAWRFRSWSSVDQTYFTNYQNAMRAVAVHDSGLIVGSTGVYRDFIVVTQCVGSQLRLVCGADLSGTCCRFQLRRIASLKDENAVEIPSGSPYLIAGRALSAGSLCIDESNSFWDVSLTVTTWNQAVLVLRIAHHLGMDFVQKWTMLHPAWNAHPGRNLADTTELVGWLAP